jgi:hypothetical protein
MAKVTITVECPSCRGTGLYEGFAERKGEPVVCLNCDGSGAVKLSYTPFTGRKQKRGVKVVRFSRGGFLLTGVGGVDGSEMTYKEFLEKVPEGKIDD